MHIYIMYIVYIYIHTYLSWYIIYAQFANVMAKNRLTNHGAGDKKTEHMKSLSFWYPAVITRNSC
jgi:hypothetical protein